MNPAKRVGMFRRSQRLGQHALVAAKSQDRHCIALYFSQTSRTAFNRQGHEQHERARSDQALVERAQRVKTGIRTCWSRNISGSWGASVALHSRSGRSRGCRAGSVIKAYRALPSFGDSAFYTWLYRIGINTAKNYLVAQGRRAPTSTGFDSEEAETFEDGDQLRDINTPKVCFTRNRSARRSMRPWNPCRGIAYGHCPARD